MKSLNSERITYAMNLAFVIFTIAYSSTRTSSAGDKVTIIYIAWFFMLVYFAGLSAAFYKSNIGRKKVSSILFKVLSVIPGLYILPGTFFHLTDRSSSYSSLNYIFIAGGLTWTACTATNLIIKNTHAKS